MNVIFDLDGTLIDSVPDIHLAVSQALVQNGLPALTLAQVKSFVGNGAPALIARSLNALGQVADGPMHAKIHADFLKEYSDNHANTVVYPNVLPALATLAKAGHHLGLCTNKPLTATRSALAQLGLAPYFQAVIGGDSLPQRKPDPAPLRETIRLLGAGPSVFVGDSEVDFETARAAGVPFFLYTEGYRKSPVATFTDAIPFNDFTALPRLIG